MIASKLGISIAVAALLTGAGVGRAQQAQQVSKAQQSGKTAAAAPLTATAASRATANAPSAPKATADTQAAEAGLSIEQLKEARDEGYRPVTRGTATLYCKSEILVGSAFPIRTCYNADRLKIVMQQEQAQRLQLQQMHGSGMEGH